MANEVQNLSRRAFFQCAATSALGTVIFLTMDLKLAAAQAKMTQREVLYQDTPKGTQQCDKCKLFQPPNSCKSVEGNVSPQGWCGVFQPNT